MENFISAITYSCPDGLTSDSLPPPSAAVRKGGSDADVITKFYGMDRLPNRPFAQWRHFPTMSRILFVFPFIFKFGNLSEV